MNTNMRLISNPAEEGLIRCDRHGWWHPAMHGHGGTDCPYCQAEENQFPEKRAEDEMTKCEVCEEVIGSVMCDDGVYRCVGCAIEDGFDIQTGDSVIEESRIS